MYQIFHQLTRNYNHFITSRYTGYRYAKPLNSTEVSFCIIYLHVSIWVSASSPSVTYFRSYVNNTCSKYTFKRNKYWAINGISLKIILFIFKQNPAFGLSYIGLGRWTDKISIKLRDKGTERKFFKSHSMVKAYLLVKAQAHTPIKEKTLNK